MQPPATLVWLGAASLNRLYFVDTAGTNNLFYGYDPLNPSAAPISMGHPIQGFEVRSACHKMIPVRDDFYEPNRQRISVVLAA